MNDKLTVILPCKNERRNIRPCLESVRGLADEILVADSGSEDGTLDIVEQVGGCRVIQREYVHSGDFKNWAIPQATHPWVLIIDADERVSEPLAEEIRRTLARPTRDGYWVYRNNYFLGHQIRYCGWQSDKVLRLFRRNEGRYVGDTDHAEVSIRTHRVGSLKQRLDHFTYWTYEQCLAKFERYTSYQAQVWEEQGRRPSAMQLLFRGPLVFLKTYVVKRGFLDGMAGIQLSMLLGYASFLKQARLWERHFALPQPDPEADQSARHDRAA